MRPAYGVWHDPNDHRRSSHSPLTWRTIDGRRRACENYFGFSYPLSQSRVRETKTGNPRGCVHAFAKSRHSIYRAVSQRDEPGTVIVVTASEPQATGPVRSDRGLAPNSFSDREMEDGDPSNCCTRVQTGAAVRRARTERVSGPRDRRWRSAELMQSGAKRSGADHSLRSSPRPPDVLATVSTGPPTRFLAGPADESRPIQIAPASYRGRRSPPGWTLRSQAGCIVIRPSNDLDMTRRASICRRSAWPPFGRRRGPSGIEKGLERYATSPDLSQRSPVGPGDEDPPTDPEAVFQRGSSV